MLGGDAVFLTQFNRTFIYLFVLLRASHVGSTEDAIEPSATQWNQSISVL